MFSKVFKVDKKSREVSSHPRPSSSNDQRPTYYPLLPSSLHDHRKRVTIHDTRAESLDQDLDLLELVCRSDSLHKRLDELQAKYERMDDGMQNLSKEARLKEMKSDKKNRPISGLFNTMRISKSFEDPEPKKPGFFQRIFRNRLSKSEDDLLDDTTSAHKRDAKTDNNFGDGNDTTVTPILKERRSASEDILSTKDLLLRPPDKRQSWSAEFSDLGEVDALLMPPPPPPPNLENLGKRGGLKRKRVIKVYNLGPLGNKNANMGSSESCCDSTDSEMELPTQSASETFFGPRQTYVASSYPPRSYQGQRYEGACAFPHCDSMNGYKNVCLTSYRHLDVINNTVEAGEREGDGKKCEPPSMPRHNSWAEGERDAVRTSQEARGEEDRKEGPAREDGRDGKELHMYQSDDSLMQEATIRKCRRKKEGVMRETQTVPGKKQIFQGTVESRPQPLHKDAHEHQEVVMSRNMQAATLALRSGPHQPSSLPNFPSDHNLPEQQPPCQELTLSKTSSAQDLPLSASSSSQELKLSRTSSSRELYATASQDLPTRLPTTASIKELDHFLSAIIQNLESQLQAGGSLSLRQQTGTAAAAKRKRKKKKEEEENMKSEDETKIELPDQQRIDHRMSECGACGRRWVEPRLLPCLHTVCTPCLHTRAALIAPTAAATATTRTASSCNRSGQGAPASASGSLDSGSGRASQERAPAGCSSAASSATTNGPAVASAPTASPTLVSSMSASPLYSSKPTKLTLTSTITYNGGNLSRHWDGESSSAHLSLTSGSGDSREEGVASSSSAGASPHSTHVLNGTAGHPEGHQRQFAQTSGQQGQWAAPDDLDSVIELLTNLSPNCSNNSYHSSHAPKQIATPTLGEGETHSKPAPSLPDEEVGSPSSTIDSRSSSRTRSSGRSSDSESGLRDRGVWVVWCPECGYEAYVPPGGVECFPLNYVLQKQLVLEALNSSSTTVYCDLCHDDVVAEERCNTCPVNLCRLCSHAHTRQRRTTHHAVISLQEARSLGIREVAHTLVCATHGEGEVGWWCRSCHEPLCAACLATLHRGHPTLTVDQEAPQARRNLTTLLDQASARMSDLLSTVEELTGAAARVQQRGKAVGDQVNAFIDDYILALEEHRHALLRQVRQACERAQRGIVTESQRAGQIASWLRQGCDLTHDLLNHAGDAEALALAPLVTHRLQALLSEQVRGWTRWERLALLREHRAGRIRGHKIHGVIADAPADPGTSRLKPLCEVSSVAAGARVSALVVARDADGQPITHGGEDLHAAVLTRDGNALCGCSVRDREDGSYEITFSPPVPSAALLHVTILGLHIQGSPMEMTVVSPSQSAGASAGDASRDGASGRRHTGVFHCCTFCSSGGDKTATCACGATMPGGYQGCGHNHAGHPGHKHWSCCAQASPSAPCTRPPSQYYQVTL